MNSKQLIDPIKRISLYFLPDQVKELLLQFYRSQRYLRALNRAQKNQSEFARLASQCKSGILIDITNQKIVWSKDHQAAFPIGSMTKIMTVLIILDQIKLDHLITMQTGLVANYGFEDIGQTIGLTVGEAYTVEQLVAGCIIYSANDCVDLLVRNFFDGKHETFVAKMNERANELGLRNTKFYNPHGLEPFAGVYWKKDNVSSAQDIAHLTAWLISTYPNILRFTSALTLDFKISETQSVCLKNTNYPLLNNCNKCDGFKTGFTTTALYSLSGTSKHMGVRYIAVAIGMSSELDRNVLVHALLELGKSSSSRLLEDSMREH